MQERYANGIYRDCRFCRGRGCLACKAEADAAYKRAFPDGPKPMATFSFDNPDDMAKMNGLIGAKALAGHFGSGGRGMNGLVDALRVAGKLEE